LPLFANNFAEITFPYAQFIDGCAGALDFLYPNLVRVVNQSPDDEFNEIFHATSPFE